MMTAGAFVRSRMSLNATGNRMFVNAVRSPDETQARNPLGVTQSGSWIGVSDRSFLGE
jgi:hypothetical protein